MLVLDYETGFGEVKDRPGTVPGKPERGRRLAVVAHWQSLGRP